ncbi:MAG TPA: carboxypeptidase-like regulatory domain-containing protein, partial [Pyrinomonadaceae bacterium]|nr:carboxypeptidase-like regulatory domain-containing protein [Pyrinomonadaceae bacterium]
MIGKSLFTFFLIFIFSLGAFAQNNQNNLSGRVADTNSANVANATVTARNLANGEQYSSQTNASGNFSFENLP